jgi:hypothetical protein
MQEGNSIYFYVVHENGSTAEFDIIYSHDITVDSIIETLELLIGLV